MDQSKKAIREAIQQRMLDISNSAAASLDGDILENLTAEDTDTPEYQKLYDVLAVFRDNVDLEYIYGVRDPDLAYTVDLRDFDHYYTDLQDTLCFHSAS